MPKGSGRVEPELGSDVGDFDILSIVCGKQTQSIRESLTSKLLISGDLCQGQSSLFVHGMSIAHLETSPHRQRFERAVGIEDRTRRRTVMKVSSFKTWMAVIAISLLTAPAYALSLIDPGVVGAASGETAPNNSPGENLIVANHLLAMLANTSDPSGCSLAGTVTCYVTGPVEYSGTLTGGTQITTTNNVAGYEWVLAKYNGPNAGYVMFHVPTWGSNVIPVTSETIWIVNQKQQNGYGLSGYVAWGPTSVPDSGATLSLLGLALAGIGAFRRFVKA